MDTIGTRIAFILEQKNLKKVQFAEKLGIHQSYVTKLVKGQTIPSDALVKLICREFRVNEDWLRYGTGDMEAPPELTTPENAALIEKVSEEYNLTETEKALLTLYLEIGPEGRDRLNAYALQMFRDNLKNPPPNAEPLTDAEIAERVAAYESLLKGVQQIERLPDGSTGTPSDTCATSGASAAG